MKVVIVAGGTGGHIYPALTLAEKLRERGDSILFIGSNSRMEKDVVPSKGFEFIGLNIEIFNGNIFHRFYSIYTMLKAYFDCLKIMKGYDLAVGFGNYISLPVIKAAKKLGMKTALHEQNSFAGKANKLLDKDVDLIVGSYEENLKQFKNKNTLILGNPQAAKAKDVKKDKNVIKNLGLDPNKKTVTIFMGSLGSQTVNKVILEFFKLCKGDYQVVYACGKQNFESVLNQANDKEYIKCFEVVDGVKTMINSSLLVCRAGATTLAEVTALGVPSIIIPSPYVPNNHQYFNGKALVDKNAALMLEEKDLTAKSLANMIDSIINDDLKLKELSDNAKKMSNPEVLNQMIDALDRI